MLMSFRTSFLITGLLVLLFLMAGPAISGTVPEKSGPDLPASEQPDSPIEITYGIQDELYMWIPASDFQPRNSSLTYAEDGNGYYYRTGGAGFGGSDFSASLTLPSGALLNGIRLYYCDADAANDIRIWFTRYYGDGAPAYEDIQTDISAGTPGCTSLLLDIDPNYTINNLSNSYSVIVRLNNATTIDLKFKGVRVWYDLQVSPAPVTATFSDVPTSHQYFQYIEALADSGITTGYADGTFRPGSYVTRGQMAVFLSKALGLHWPY